ncbi:MAG: peptidoglycan-binding domain-containing protein [Gemmatimonadaceae bacterium]
MGSSLLKRRCATGWGIAVTLAAASPAPAQSRVVVPAGSVIIVRTEVPLQSASMKTGQAFETTVVENVGVDEFTVIPAGSKIRGVVASATPATRQRSGVIEVVFDRLRITDGSVYSLSGKLTSTDSAERQQIKSNANARVLLVGERGGIGAGVAGASRSSNNILSALGAILSEGRDVDVAAGTQLAVELDRALALRSRGRVILSAGSIYTAADRVRDAQRALANHGYYRGAITGTLDDATRRALFEYQVDNRLRSTGNLDALTAQKLGLDLTDGLTGAALSAEAASTLRRDAQSVLTRARTELGASALGRLSRSRGYTQAELDLWFALSAFADNTSIYEQVVRNGDNPDAAVLAGRSLLNAMRRVDTAMQGTRTSVALQNSWASVRSELRSIE